MEEEETKYINGHPYTRKDLDRDISALLRIGMIEIVGITDEGEWIYSATEKSMNMTEAERITLILNSYEDEQNGYGFM